METRKQGIHWRTPLQSKHGPTLFPGRSFLHINSNEPSATQPANHHMFPWNTLLLLGFEEMLCHLEHEHKEKEVLLFPVCAQAEVPIVNDLSNIITLDSTS